MMYPGRNRGACLPIFGVMFIAFFLLARCKPRETKMSFETIEQNEYIESSGYSGDEIQLKIVSSTDEVNELGTWVSEDSRSKIRELDFTSEFALAVFRGKMPSSGYNIEIVKVARQNTVVNLQIILLDPIPEIQKNDIETSPYHLVKIEKDGKWNEVITFNLINEGAQIQSLAHFIP